MEMENLYKKFCTEKFDENGVLNYFKIDCPDNFNFAYDIVDKIAEYEPNRRAMVWTDEHGAEKVFSFADMSKYSNKVANMLTAKGVKKGDKVMLILKRHYEFWFAILALHKIGAIAIPATNLLTTKDIVYRTGAASISGIICSGTCHISDYVDEAEGKCGKFTVKILARAHKDGWDNFDDEIEKYSDKFERIENNKHEDMLAYFTSGTTGNPKLVMHDYSYPLAHIITAKYWHCCEPDGLHLTLAETGWAKAAWGKLYGQWVTA
ncbi:MAG: AMP-binding protein, partial [Oscillospiraceae bacterium]